VLPHFGDAHFGLLHPLASLEEERLGDDADGERAQVFRDLRDNRGRAGAGAAAHAAGDEHQVGALERVEDFVAVLVDGLAADLRPRAGAQSTGELLADLHLHVGLVLLQGLRVGVDRDELDGLDPLVDHPIEGVPAAAAHADDLHARVLRHRLFELEDHGCLGSPIRRSPAAIA
jgi:hypothetical protein